MPGQSVEETIQMVVDLPDGQDWAWLPDCNILAVSSRLTAAEREAALDDVQATWRRRMLRPVPDAEDKACPGAA